MLDGGARKAKSDSGRCVERRRGQGQGQGCGGAAATSSSQCSVVQGEVDTSKVRGLKGSP